MTKYWLPLLPLLLSFAATADSIPLFSAAAMTEWEYQTFRDIRETDYHVEFDDALNRPVLIANSRGGASGYTLKRDINLQDTPWLHFLWRVDDVGDNTAEKSKSGDDFAWRVYFVGRSGMQYRTLTLVLSQNATAGETWESPYAGFLSHIYLHALASRDDTRRGVWQASRLNVGELWREVFASEANIGLVGLMTDGDNADIVMRARYGAMVLSDSPQSPFAGVATAD